MVTVAGALILPALLLALSGCTATMPSPVDASDERQTTPAETVPAANTVMTVGLKFMPTDVTVGAGTTLTWRNGETITHTVTSGAWGEVNEATGLRGTETPDGLFDHTLAPMGREGDAFSYTFDEPGEYLYYCGVHLTMNATVTVIP